MVKIPPVAPIEPTTHKIHNHTRVDNYAWMKDREDPRLVQYLEQENDYTTEIAEEWDGLPESLFGEMRSRIKEDDQSVPYRLKDFIYYTRFATGLEYPIFARRKGSMEGAEEILLNVNEVAEGLSYCQVANLKVSENQQLLAYALDTQGRRIYTIRIRDLETGKDLPDEISEVTPSIAWANDNKTVFYIRQDPDTLRPFQLYRHQLATATDDDVLVFEETDDTFHMGLYKTKSRRFLAAVSGQTMTTEVRLLEADDPEGDFRVVLPRDRGHEYSVDHFKDHLYLRTNKDAPNFRLVKTPIESSSEASWLDVIPHKPKVFHEGCEIFSDHLVVAERELGLTRLRVIPWDGRPEHTVSFDDPAYTAYLHVNAEFDTTVVRYGYTSLTTPNSVYDYEMDKRKNTLLKQTEVLGDFSSENYRSERLWATGRDGTEIPISLVYRKTESNDKNPGPLPLLLYGYGAYGIESEPAFSSKILSLLDRGFAYAIAHVRGGEELGRAWYDGGRTENKQNSFSDFIDVGDHLVAEGWTRPNRLYALGGSAGGLLVGAVMNQRPDLFNGIVAAVPFVDVVTTMLDASIPLTTGEYDEWGNPEDPGAYKTILAYSPYDNVVPQKYPNLLVTSGLHDSQVQYWEPTKWVAKLRAVGTGNSLLLLKTNMEAGHSGASGRFESLKESAFEFAFLLSLEKTRTGAL